MTMIGNLGLFTNKPKQKLTVLVVEKIAEYHIGLVKSVKIGIGAENALKLKMKHMLTIKENTNYT